MDFGWPKTEIGRKMASGRLLFLALRVLIQVHEAFTPCVYLAS